MSSWRCFWIPEILLRIYNPLGDVDAVPVDGIQGAGERSVTWDAAGVSTGVYFYKLEADAFLETRKLDVMR